MKIEKWKLFLNEKVFVNSNKTFYLFLRRCLKYEKKHYHTNLDWYNHTLNFSWYFELNSKFKNPESQIRISDHNCNQRWYAFEAVNWKFDNTNFLIEFLKIPEKFLNSRWLKLKKSLEN